MRWRRSFRTRVVVLVGLLTAVAIGVTVWVTIAATSQTLTDSVEAQQQDVDVIVDQLRAYGVLHGTWIGVPDLAEQLRGQTGLRIKLTTEYGEVVVDTDTLEGRTARPASSVAPLAVIPRPTLDLSGVTSAAAATTTLTDIASYRAGAFVAACLTGAGLSVPTLPAEHGITGVATDDSTAHEAACGPPPTDPTVTARSTMRFCAT